MKWKTFLGTLKKPEIQKKIIGRINLIFWNINF